jgi:hypothetical protein
MRPLLTASLCLMASYASPSSLSGVWVYVGGTPTGETAGLWRVEAQSGSYELVAPGDFQDFDLSPNARTAYVLDEGAVKAIDTATGRVRTLSSGDLLSNPTEIAVSSDGIVYVADGHYGNNWAILEIDPRTGDQSLVTADGINSLRFSEAIDDAIDEVVDMTFTSDDRLMVSAWCCSPIGGPQDDEILNIDLETGDEALVHFETSSGGMTGVGADQLGNTYVVLGLTAGHQVLVIDPSLSVDWIGSTIGIMPGATPPLTLPDDFFHTLFNDIDALDPETIFLTAWCCGGGADPDFDGDGIIDGDGLYLLSRFPGDPGGFLRPVDAPILHGDFYEVKAVSRHPIPEPNSVLLLLAGGVLVGRALRRQT